MQIRINSKQIHFGFEKHKSNTEYIEIVHVNSRCLIKFTFVKKKTSVKNRKILSFRKKCPTDVHMVFHVLIFDAFLVESEW
jgi:hypothetical protein